MGVQASKHNHINQLFLQILFHGNKSICNKYISLSFLSERSQPAFQQRNTPLLPAILHHSHVLLLAHILLFFPALYHKYTEKTFFYQNRQSSPVKLFLNRSLRHLLRIKKGNRQRMANNQGWLG